MGRSSFRLTVSSVLVTFLACGGPQLPTLDRPSQTAVSRVRIAGKLTTQTIRELVAALNTNGSFPGLARFIDGESEESLSAWAELISKYWYRDADRSDGLVGWVQRLPESQFRRNLVEAQSWLAVPEHQNPFRFVQSMAGHADFPVVAKAFAPALMLQFPAHSEVSIQPISVEESRELARDFTKLLKHTSGTERLSRALSAFGSRDALQAFVNSGRVLQEDRGELFWSRLADQISLLLQAPFQATNDPAPTNQLSVLLELARAFNRPSNGAFEHLAIEIAQNGAIRQVFDEFLAKRIQSVASRAVSRELIKASLQRNFWMSLADPAAPDHDVAGQRLFWILFKAMRPITTIPPAGPEDIRFERTASLYLNTLALVQWFESVLSANRGLIASQTADDFTEHLINLSLDIPAATTKVSVFITNGRRLSAGIELRLRALGLNDFTDELSVAISSGRLLGITYPFEARSNRSIAQMLLPCMTVINGTRPLVQTHEAAGAILQLMGSTVPGLPFTAASFETNNVLVDLLSWLRARPSSIRAIHDLNALFIDAGFGTLGVEGIRTVRALFAGKPEWQDWVDSTLPKLPALMRALGLATPLQPVANPALVEWLYEFLQGISNQQLRNLVNAISGIAELQLFDPSAYPAFVAFVGKSARLKGWAQSFGQVSLSMEPSVIDILSASFGNHLSLERPLRILRDSSGDENGMLSLVYFLLGPEGQLPWRPMVSSEREWIKKFLDTGGLELLFQAMGETRRERIRATLFDLEEAVKRGDSTTLLALLSTVNDERFRAGIDALIVRDRSGELLALLQLVKLWFT